MKYEAQILLGNAGHIQFRFEFLLIENKNQCCVKEFSSGLVNIVPKSYDFFTCFVKIVCEKSVGKLIHLTSLPQHLRSMLSHEGSSSCQSSGTSSVDFWSHFSDDESS